MIDIRNASRKKGTVPPKHIAEEHDVPRIPGVTEEQEISIPSDKFSGDEVIKLYMDYLEEHGITEQDVHDVIDALITSGNVSYKFDLLGKIPVEFTVRPAWVNDAIMEIIDSETSAGKNLSVVHYNNLVAVSNLAASMAQYGKEKFTINSKEDFNNARERVGKMPYVLQIALVNKLAIFDRLLAVATSDWAVENFITPQKA